MISHSLVTSLTNIFSIFLDFGYRKVLAASLILKMILALMLFNR